MPNTIPEDINSYVRNLAEQSTLQTFFELCEALKAFHKNPPPGLTITYEAEFGPKLKCQKIGPTCEDSAKYGCPCQLLYSFRKANLDYERYKAISYKGRLITPFLLMDYGLLYKVWIHDPDSVKDFPKKLGTIISLALEEEETFVVCTFDSSPPEWLNLNIEPAKHLVKLDINEVGGIQTELEDYPSDPDLHWEALPTIEDQLKHWRASVQGTNWAWDRLTDPDNYFLIGETYTEKIYWPKDMGTRFLPFSFKTQHTTLLQHYKRKTERYCQKRLASSVLSARAYRAALNRSMQSDLAGSSQTPSLDLTSDNNLDNLMET